jgi:hypothetical protein
MIVFLFQRITSRVSDRLHSHSSSPLERLLLIYLHNYDLLSLIPLPQIVIIVMNSLFITREGGMKFSPNLFKKLAPEGQVLAKLVSGNSNHYGGRVSLFMGLEDQSLLLVEGNMGKFCKQLNKLLFTELELMEWLLTWMVPPRT